MVFRSWGVCSRNRFFVMEKRIFIDVSVLELDVGSIELLK
jgi:hypothetical protein